MLSVPGNAPVLLSSGIRPTPRSEARSQASIRSKYRMLGGAANMAPS